jgi:hypothetical protein
MKTIVVRWIPEKEYGKSMLVIASDHPRFVMGSRFDYGFMGIATNEGYTIISLPMDDIIKSVTS